MLTHLKSAVVLKQGLETQKNESFGLCTSSKTMFNMDDDRLVGCLPLSRTRENTIGQPEPVYRGITVTNESNVSFQSTVTNL